MYNKIDFSKVTALLEAGWDMGQVAAEMGMEKEALEDAVSKHSKTGKEPALAKKEEKEKDGALDAVPVCITAGQLRDIYEKSASIGAREGIKAFRRKQEEEHAGRADRRLRNTKLLLRNYHMLKDHAGQSVFGRTQMEESALDILESMMSMYDNEVIIESIKRSATRTAVIVSHIETMFRLYYAYCDNSATRELDVRRYNTIWDAYMADTPLSVSEIAKKQHISKDSVYMDIRVSIEKLTSLIFGVDGLRVY